MAWTDGDFKLFAAGLAIGGQWNLGEVKVGDVVECWNDEGVYDYFYMKFKKAVKEFSYGQFKNTVKVYSIANDSYIPITGVTRISGTQFKVNCNISGENSGVIVLGLPTAYLQYESGSAVPKFISTFYVSGIETMRTYAYVWDKANTKIMKLQVRENITLLCVDTKVFTLKDAVTPYNPFLTVGENVDLGYYQ